MPPIRDWKYIAMCKCGRYYTNAKRERTCPKCNVKVKFEEINPVDDEVVNKSGQSGQQQQIYVAPSEGTYVSMISLDPGKIHVLANQYLQAGESIPHPPGYTVLLVVAPTSHAKM